MNGVGILIIVLGDDAVVWCNGLVQAVVLCVLGLLVLLLSVVCWGEMLYVLLLLSCCLLQRSGCLLLVLCFRCCLGVVNNLGGRLRVAKQ